MYLKFNRIRNNYYNNTNIRQINVKKGLKKPLPQPGGLKVEVTIFFTLILINLSNLYQFTLQSATTYIVSALTIVQANSYLNFYNRFNLKKNESPHYFTFKVPSCVFKYNRKKRWWNIPSQSNVDYFDAFIIYKMRTHLRSG